MSDLYLELIRWHELETALTEKDRVSAFPWLPLRTVERFVPLMRERGVSMICRSPTGFLPAYRRARTPYKLSVRWWVRRNGLIRRHHAQCKLRMEPLFVKRDGIRYPSDRHLCLIAWAFSPKAQALRETV